MMIARNRLLKIQHSLDELNVVVRDEAMVKWKRFVFNINPFIHPNRMRGKRNNKYLLLFDFCLLYVPTWYDTEK
jgi:hypothetical protein